MTFDTDAPMRSQRNRVDSHTPLVSPRARRRGSTFADIRIAALKPQFDVN